MQGPPLQGALTRGGVGWHAPSSPFSKGTKAALVHSGWPAPEGPRPGHSTALYAPQVRPPGLAPPPCLRPNGPPPGHPSAHHEPFAWSPCSFFFWDRPVLLVLDQEKKAPFLFFSLSSSPSSSFRDLPDFDFPLSCHPMETLT